MTIDSVYLDIADLPADLLVLTPNRRLAAWLGRDHDSVQQSRGLASWPRLNAVPLEQWLQQLFEEICLLVAPERGGHPRLLSASQSALLWRQVLEQHWQNGDDIDGLVTLAQQARGLILRWRWKPAQWQAAGKFEQVEFARWHQAYCELLEQHCCLDQAGLAGWVMAHGAALLSGFPRHVYLHGFNDPDEPQLRQFIDWLAQDGIQVRFSTNPPRSSQPEVVTLPQVDDQFAHAIHWALQQRGSVGRVGVVIPNLQSRRARVRALCKHEWSQQPDADQHHWSEIINITAAQKLPEYPLVAQWLLWLRGLGGELPLQEWSLLLTSPYCCASQAEWLQRDSFCQWLREENQRSLYLPVLRDLWSKRCGEDDTLEWLGQLGALHVRARQPVARWIQWFRRFVTLVNSRQSRSLDSEEFQLQQRMLETVAQLQELHDWLGDIDFGRFRSELESALGNVQFQPQTETAPVQVMGILEAAGLGFDALWVCELEAVNWPQQLNPNPLLSRSQQRTMNMPGASPERELQYASRLLAGFQAAAANVVFSWGEWQGDTEHTLSALVAGLPASAVATTDLLSAERQQFDQFHSSIEIVPADVMGSPVSALHAKGGSGLIKSQSLCPFKAFAEYRLNLRAQDDLADGVKAVDRGSLLHKVMESIWRLLRDSASLQTLLEDETQLDSWLNEIIDQEMQGFRRDVQLHPDALYQLERLRTFSIARRWLQECDGPRQPFTVVQVEKRRTLVIGGLELDLAVDRVDQLQDGCQVIVDYKTGDKDQKAWTGERPEEPQLPLYTLLEKDKTKGVLFGVLKPDVLKYKGLLQNRNAMLLGRNSDLKEADDWDQQMLDWQNTLERLAEEFRQGRAEVAPLNDKICSYCHLAAVCRVNEVPHERD